MKNKLILSSILVLAACLSESKFTEKFGEKLCEEYETCNADIECTTGDDDDDTSTADCTFDKKKAKECLDGDYVCNDEFGEGFEFVETPAACADVYTDCGGTGDDDDTTGDDDDTTGDDDDTTAE